MVEKEKKNKTMVPKPVLLLYEYFLSSKMQ